MRWGYGWELGPFEIWDAIGVREGLVAVQTTSEVAVPPSVQGMLDAGENRFRHGGLPPAGSDLQILKAARDRGRVVRHNAGVSLVDLEDGVLAVEFHSKMNTIGGDTVQMLQAGVKEAARTKTALPPPAPFSARRASPSLDLGQQIECVVAGLTGDRAEPAS